MTKPNHRSRNAGACSATTAAAPVVPAPSRSRSLHRWIRFASCAVAAATIWACGPVYIPVPPPGQAVSFTSEALTDSTGAAHTFWIATGPTNTAARNAQFYLFDQQRNGGVIAGAGLDGSYTAPPFEGSEGDNVFVHYQTPEGRLSATFCVLLSETRPAALACP